MPTLPLPIPGEMDTALTTPYAPLAYESDHEGTGVDLLLEQFQGKPYVEGLLTSYLAQVQDVEESVWGVLLAADVDLAQDAQLDGLGDIVGEPRRDRSDEDYRAAIRVRVLINRCSGRHSQILEILRLYLGATIGDGTIELREPAPAALALNVYRVPSLPADLRTIARTTKPAGVNLDGRYETSATRPARFGWSGGAVAGVTGPDNGFGWSLDDSVGGLFAARI
jgi:hypothetical protein